MVNCRIKLATSYKKIGHAYFEKNRQRTFQPNDFGGKKEYSEQTAWLIDEEVKQILDTQYESARKILDDNQAALYEGARLLLDEEMITGDQLNGILKKYR